MRRNYVILFMIVYVTMLLFGLVESIKGVSFPLIKEGFKAQYDSQGGLVSVSSFGYVLFCIVATISVQKLGVKVSLILGYIYIILGSIAVIVAPSFFIITLSLALISMGFGFFEISNNALATTIFARKTAIFMSLMHFFYGLGAVLGPKFAINILNHLDHDYKGIYAIILIPIVIVLFFIIISRFKITHTSTGQKPTLTIKQALSNKYIWLFSIGLGFMEVIEFGAANWGNFYLIDELGLPLTITSTFVSVFYLFFTLSRLLSGFGIERIGYMKSLILALSIVLILYIIGFSLNQDGIWLLSFTGFFIAILWPTIMSLAIKIFGPDAPFASSVIIVISGIINGIMQLVTGIINEYIGPRYGYSFSVIYVLISLIIIIYLNKQIKKNEKGC